jgi:hypothetical protein
MSNAILDSNETQSATDDQWTVLQSLAANGVRAVGEQNGEAHDSDAIG